MRKATAKQEVLTIELVKLSESGKAWLMKCGDYTDWMPLSQVKSWQLNGPSKPGTTGLIAVSGWIAEKKFKNNPDARRV